MKRTNEKIYEEKSKTFIMLCCLLISKSVFFYNAIFLERKEFF